MPPSNMPKATNPVKPAGDAKHNEVDIGKQPMSTQPMPNPVEGQEVQPPMPDKYSVADKHSEVDKHSETDKHSEAYNAKQPMQHVDNPALGTPADKHVMQGPNVDKPTAQELEEYTPGWQSAPLLQSPYVDNTNAKPNMPVPNVEPNLVVHHPYTVQEQQAGMSPMAPNAIMPNELMPEYVSAPGDDPVSDRLKRQLHRNVVDCVGAMFMQHDGSAFAVMAIVRDLQQVLRVANTQSMTYDALHNSVQSAVERYTMPNDMRKVVKPVMMAIVEYMHVLIGQERLNAVQVYVYLVEVLGWVHNAASLYHAREE